MSSDMLVFKVSVFANEKSLEKPSQISDITLAFLSEKISKLNDHPEYLTAKPDESITCASNGPFWPKECKI